MLYIEQTFTNERRIIMNKKGFIKNLLSVSSLAVALSTGLSVNLASADETTDTSNIEFGTEYKGAVYDGLEGDINTSYTITVPSSGKVSFSILVNLDDGNSHDLEYTLTDTNGVKCYSGSAQDTEKAEFACDLLAGTYKINFSEGWANGLGDYTQYSLTANFQAYEETFSETTTANDNIKENANVITEKADIKGMFALGDTIDMYRFKVTKAGKYSIKFVAGINGMTLNIENTFGEYKYSDTINGNDKHTYVLGKGTYYLTVKSNNTGFYNFKTSVSNLSTSKIKKTSVKKAIPTGKNITVKWTRKSDVNGYFLQVATDAKFKHVVKYYVNDFRLSSLNIYNKKNSKVYIRICTYTNVGDKTVYSDWSKSKKVKLK